VKNVELVHREQIDVLLDFVDAEKVSCDVQHRSTPSESRLVDDANGRNRPGDRRDRHVRLDRGRQQLSKRLYAVEESSRLPAHDAHRVAGHQNLVTLRSQLATIGRETQRDFSSNDRGIRVCDRYRKTRRWPQQSGKHFRSPCDLGVADIDRDHGCGVERERITADHHVPCWCRHEPRSVSGKLPDRWRWRPGAAAGDEDAASEHECGTHIDAITGRRDARKQ
jgi:hypothetical protein